MVAILALSVAMNRLEKKPSLYTQVGMVFLLFFTFTSGFAVQYLAWLTPWVAELGALPVALFMVTGSVFLLVVYNYWTLGMPWYMAIAYPWSSHQYFQVLCWLSVMILAFAAWRHIRYGHVIMAASPERVTPDRISPALRVVAGSLVVTAFLVVPAIIHMRRDRLGVSPAYAEDDVLYTQADELHNLADELYRRGRSSEAGAVQIQSDMLTRQGQTITDALVHAQPARMYLRIPEDYVDASLDDYNRGDYTQCVSDATESLKLRPGMPAAWNNISLCNAELGDWDGAIAAATQALRIEPESDVVRENLDMAIAGKRRAVSGY